MYGQGSSTGGPYFRERETHRSGRPLSSSVGGGFFHSLFDFSFSTFVTPKLVRLAYLLAVVGGALLGAMGVLVGVARGGATAVAAFFFIPLVFLAWAAYMRIILEILIVVFRIAEPVQDAAATLEELKGLVERNRTGGFDHVATTEAATRGQDSESGKVPPTSVEKVGAPDQSAAADDAPPDSAEGEALEVSRFCTKCGERNDSENRFCFSCGTRLGSEQR